jgi:hypothetical protein
MRIRDLVVRAGIAGAVAVGIPLATAGLATAAPVSPSDFTCGLTMPVTPCNQTAHFNTPSGTDAPEVGTPNPGATGCPAFVSTDAAVIQGTGNGIEHSIVNNAGDSWFTSTFTGTVTLTSWTFDPSTQSLIAPDPNVPVFTGHLTQWFGGSFNQNNMVNHGTMTFSGAAADGTTIHLHMVSHMNTTPHPAAAPNSFNNVSC